MICCLVNYGTFFFQLGMSVVGPLVTYQVEKQRNVIGP